MKLLWNSSINFIQTPTDKIVNMVRAIKLHIDDHEQPQPHYRFRYATEGQSGAILTSVGSGKSSRSFPQVKVLHYTGWVRVRCSCVTANGPMYKPHPFRLAGQNCKNGVFELDTLITESERRIALRNVGVQCVKLRELRDSNLLQKCFTERQNMNVNPFNTPWDQFDVKQDGHSVRLCFEVTAIKSKDGDPLPDLRSAQPIVTNVIHGKLTSDDLKIYRMSLLSAPATGNCELMILCSKVQATDIEIRFYEERTKWSQVVQVRTSDVHKQYAIVTHVPRFHDVNIVKPAKIRIELIRPSSGEHSRPVNFQYMPVAATSAQPYGDTSVASVASSKERRKRMRSNIMMSGSFVGDNDRTSTFSASSDAESSSMFNSSQSSASPPPPSNQDLHLSKTSDQPEPDCISNSAMMKSMIGKRLKTRIKAKDEHKHAQSNRKESAPLTGAQLSCELAQPTTQIYAYDAHNEVHVPDASGSDAKETTSTDADSASHPNSSAWASSQFSTIDYSDEAGSTSYVTTLSNSSMQSSAGASMFISHTGELASDGLRFVLSSDDSGIDVVTPVTGMIVVPTLLNFPGNALSQSGFTTRPILRLSQGLLATDALSAQALNGLMALSGSSSGTSSVTMATPVYGLNHRLVQAKIPDTDGQCEDSSTSKSDVVALDVCASDVVIEKVSTAPAE